MIGSWERKKCDWLLFTVSKSDSGAKQSAAGRSQGPGAGASGGGYSGGARRPDTVTGPGPRETSTELTRGKPADTTGKKN